MSIISDPIIPLGQRVLGSSVAYRRSKVRYDYALADLAFLTATSKEFPYTRQTAPFRKEQFDNSSNPGEQALSQWWLRSQSDFSFGTGIKFMEPSNDVEVMSAFADSAGIDPWTPGQLTLLKATTLKNASAVDTLVYGTSEGSVDIFYQAEGNVLTRETTGSSAAVAWGGANTIQAMTSDGAYIIVADNVGIYRSIGGGGGSLIWNTGSSNVCLGYPKQRLVAGIGNAIYELTSGGPALPTPLYSHPSSSWKWTSIAEGPGAIYAAGYNNNESAIYKFVLSTAGVMPTLTSGIIAAKMPSGERINSIESYLGTYLAIATNKGVRVGVMAENGDISYGPLVIESSTEVYDLVGWDRFIFVTCTNQINGNSGLWRIDLGNPLDDGSFPYATDLQAGVPGVVNSVTVFGTSGRMVFGISGQGSYIEHATDLVTSGTMRTGYIRFNTIEPKQFRYVTVRMADSTGSVSVETYDRNGSATSVVSITEYDQNDYDLGRTAADEYLALRFTLTRESATLGPTLNSWQVKALPAVTRSRLINVPILLFEKMRDAKGAQVPPTEVSAVLGVLEQYEDRAQPILFTELHHNPNRSELVVVDEVRFQKTSPPNGADGDGGIVYLTLRTVQ